MQQLFVPREIHTSLDPNRPVRQKQLDPLGNPPPKNTARELQVVASATTTTRRAAPSSRGAFPASLTPDDTTVSLVLIPKSEVSLQMDEPCLPGVVKEIRFSRQTFL